MEDKKLLYGILAVCVVTLVVSGISVYEVNTVAKQLNTQGEQIAALQEAQAPMNVLCDDLRAQVNTQGEQIVALKQSRLRLIADVAEPEVVINDVAEPEANAASETAEETYPEANVVIKDVVEPEANVVSEDVEETPDEGFNPNGPPENRALVPADPLRE